MTARLVDPAVPTASVAYEQEVESVIAALTTVLQRTQQFSLLTNQVDLRWTALKLLNDEAVREPEMQTAEVASTVRAGEFRFFCW